MTRILSWNVQNGKGCDGVVSLERIANVIADMGRPDVLCLQEVSRGLRLTRDAEAPDQIAELVRLFPDYEVTFGVAVDALSLHENRRWQFGNAVLTRLPLLSRSFHTMPRPADAGVRHMTRQATEVVVATTRGPLRIVNLHLEFHSPVQRLAQVDRLRDLQEEALEERRLPPHVDATGPYQQVVRPADSVFCGDFNMVYGSEEYERLLAPLGSDAYPFRDAWTVVHPGRVHEPTCGIYDHAQWPNGPHCRDFFFLNGNCVAALKAVRVNGETNASDHQPVLLELSNDPL